MTTAKSPGAVAACGVSESNQLGRQVASEISLHQRDAQVPIRATLFGSDRCEAEGIIAINPAPVLALCRGLVRAGHNRCRPLHAYRGTTLALIVRTIGEGAAFTVDDDRQGRPRLRRWRDRVRDRGTGSPVRENDAARLVIGGDERSHS